MGNIPDSQEHGICLSAKASTSDPFIGGPKSREELSWDPGQRPTHGFFRDNPQGDQRKVFNVTSESVPSHQLMRFPVTSPALLRAGLHKLPRSSCLVRHGDPRTMNQTSKKFRKESVPIGGVELSVVSQSYFQKERAQNCIRLSMEKSQCASNYSK